MKRNKGFSLVELLVSLLVVSIALLGFAALQTFSARTIRSAEQKNLGNEVTQSVVKYLQMSQDSVRAIAWNGGNTILVSCTDITGDFDVAKQVLGATLGNGLFDLCVSVGNVSGVQGDDLALQIQRDFPQNMAINDYAFYSVEVRYAYRPLTIQNNQNDGQVDAEAITVGTYCPFNDQNVQNSANLRRNNNVVCDIAEVRL